MLKKATTDFMETDTSGNTVCSSCWCVVLLSVFLQLCLCVAIEALCASWCLMSFVFSRLENDLQNHLKPWSKQFTCFYEHPHPMNSLQPFTSQPDVKMSSFYFPLLDYYLVMSECSCSWCVVSVFATSCYLLTFAWHHTAKYDWQNSWAICYWQ